MEEEKEKKIVLLQSLGTHVGMGAQLLAEESGGGSGWYMYVFLIVIVVLFIAFLFFSGRKNRSRDREYAEQLDAIRPGNKVMSRGGLCGIVVEVCDDNTVIIESGSESTGKSYFKLAKEGIYETDAKGPTQIAREEAELRRKAEKEAKLAEKEGRAPALPEEDGSPDAEVPEETAEAPEEKGEEQE